MPNRPLAETSTLASVRIRTLEFACDDIGQESEICPSPKISNDAKSDSGRLLAAAWSPHRLIALPREAFLERSPCSVNDKWPMQLPHSSEAVSAPIRMHVRLSLSSPVSQPILLRIYPAHPRTCCIFQADLPVLLCLLHPMDAVDGLPAMQLWDV
jgi:hypothetical protein